ncbi:helix-turn-helix transcriptional regulator [Clostridioides difficile]|nr:helix-turn-helix transcriptional regulator [Clostridioides difficile]
MNIGKKIKFLINNSGLTLTDISAKTKIPTSTLSDIINGKTKNLSIQKAKLICDVFNCSLDYLLDDEVDEKDINKSDYLNKQLIEKYKLLKYEYKEFVLSQIDGLLKIQNNTNSEFKK